MAECRLVQPQLAFYTSMMENPQNASGFHSKQALQLENNHRTANARQECMLT